jgi:hypothetical protein
MSEEQKQFLRERFSGEGNPFFGQTHSNKTRAKVRKNHADFSGDNNPYRKSLGDPKKRAEARARAKAMWDARDRAWREKFGQKHRKGVGEIPATFWSRTRHNARIRDLVFEVTIEDAWGLFLFQGRRCALSGALIDFGCGKDWPTASLDRKDSTLGYTLDNIQWLHKRVNMAKQVMTDPEFIEMCRQVYEHSRQSLS